MHVVCAGQLKIKTPGACGGWSRGRAPPGTGPALPHTDVALPACRNLPALRPRRGWPRDCTRGWQDVASACADVYKSRYPSGVRQAALGDVVRSKAFPRPRRASHGSAELGTMSVPFLRAWRAFLGSAVGKQPEDPCCGSGWCWMPQVYIGCPSVWTRVWSCPVPAYSLRRGASTVAPAVAPALCCQCSAPARLLSLPFPCLSPWDARP